MAFRKRKKKEEDQFEWNTKSTYDSTWRSVGEFILEIFKVIVISLAIIIPVRYFLIQPFYVKGASMEPNFFDHEYLIINEIGYRFEEPDRGDIVVFRYPRDPRQYFIKRIIGLPGETVSVENGEVSILNPEHPEGFVIEESYLKGASTPGSKETVLGHDEYFVLGDNRDASLDSRNFGPVPRRLIVGKAWFRGWPFDRITIFDTPQYNL